MIVFENKVFFIRLYFKVGTRCPCPCVCKRLPKSKNLHNLWFLIVPKLELGNERCSLFCRPFRACYIIALTRGFTPGYILSALRACCSAGFQPAGFNAVGCRGEAFAKFGVNALLC